MMERNDYESKNDNNDVDADGIIGHVSTIKDGLSDGLGEECGI